MALPEMHFIQDGNECAAALYKYSIQLISHLEQERNLLKITESIQALYAALDVVTVPSIEATIRKRLAQVLQYYTEEYKEIAFQYEKANTIYDQTDDFKFDLLDKIIIFYQYHLVDIGMVKNTLDQACKRAKNNGWKEWLFYFQCKK